jgi:hypothetical protein
MMQKLRMFGAFKRAEYSQSRDARQWRRPVAGGVDTGT